MVMANPKRNLEREAVICSLYRDGKTLQEVGDVFGLTRERVRQILRRAGVSPTQGGVRKRSERRRYSAKLAKSMPYHLAEAAPRVAQGWRAYERDARAQAWFGCYRDEVVSLNDGLCISHKDGKALKYTEQRRNAERRGIEWNLTFADWLRVWEESGHLDVRGRRQNRYCMARISDIGPYDVQNVYITTIAANVADYQATLKVRGVLCADGYKRQPGNPNIDAIGVKAVP